VSSAAEASMKLKLLAIVMLVVVGVGAAYVALGGLPTSAASTTRYLTGTAVTGNVSDDVAATGTVAATDSYGLQFGAVPHLVASTDSSSSSSSSGGSSTTWTVTDVKVAVGDRVKDGQSLASASPADLARQLANAEAALGSARLQQKTAQDNVDALTSSSSTDQVRQAKIALNNAKSQASDASKARADIVDQMRLGTIKAPIAGIVTAVNISKGLTAPSGDAITIDADTFDVTASVVESDVAKMAVGQAADVSIAAVDADLTGKVKAIAPTATGNTTGNVVDYAVTISLENPPTGVRAGMTADVTITIATANNVLTVPAAALRGTTGNYSVLVVGADGTPAAQGVEVGLVTNSTAEIKSGLTEGEQVVTGVANAQTGTPTVTNGGFGGGGIAIPGGGFGGGGGRNRLGN
jgi:macrolide-specific efflux system membrane fusion protein